MTKHHHFSADHEEFIRRHFTEELGDEPVYIRTEHEAGLSPCPHECGAFTSSNLDLRMRAALKANGRWYGRGFSVALPSEGRAFHRMSWPSQLNLLLHELAHFMADRPKILVDADPAPDESHPLGIAQRADVSLFQHDNTFEHGPSFVRAALHIHRRAAPDAGLFAMQIFHEQYRSPSAHDALDALGDELRQGGCIVDVCSTPAPESFLALWPSEEAARLERFAISSRILNSVWTAHGVGLMPATT